MYCPVRRKKGREGRERGAREEGRGGVGEGKVKGKVGVKEIGREGAGEEMKERGERAALRPLEILFTLNCSRCEPVN